MAIRMNAGYVITGSIHVGDVEFVIGTSSTAPSQFVTWECKGGDNYYWGHYMSDELAAVGDLLERAGQELEFRKKLQERAAKDGVCGSYTHKEVKEHDER